MCGLSGEIRFDGNPADTDAVSRMVDQLTPRGPDGQGIWSAGRVAFGHRRLSVIDLSAAGGQPMVDNQLGLTAVFNGCIYDYQELRAELEGHGYRFFSRSDTEVILKAYHRWGQACVEHFKGMFAFASADPEVAVFNPQGVWFLLGAGLAAAAFVVHLIRADSPIIPRAALAAVPAWGSLLVSFLVGWALIAALVIAASDGLQTQWLLDASVDHEAALEMLDALLAGLWSD